MDRRARRDRAMHPRGSGSTWPRRRFGFWDVHSTPHINGSTRMAVAIVEEISLLRDLTAEPLAEVTLLRRTKEPRRRLLRRWWTGQRRPGARRPVMRAPPNEGRCSLPLGIRLSPETTERPSESTSTDWPDRVERPTRLLTWPPSPGRAPLRWTTAVVALAPAACVGRAAAPDSLSTVFWADSGPPVPGSGNSGTTTAKGHARPVCFHPKSAARGATGTWSRPQFDGKAVGRRDLTYTDLVEVFLKRPSIVAKPSVLNWGGGSSSPQQCSARGRGSRNWRTCPTRSPPGAQRCRARGYGIMQAFRQCCRSSGPVRLHDEEPSEARRPQTTRGQGLHHGRDQGDAAELGTVEAAAVTFAAATGLRPSVAGVGRAPRRRQDPTRICLCAGRRRSGHDARFRSPGRRSTR